MNLALAKPLGLALPLSCRSTIGALSASCFEGTNHEIANGQDSALLGRCRIRRHEVRSSQPNQTSTARSDFTAIRTSWLCDARPRCEWQNHLESQPAVFDHAG